MSVATIDRASAVADFAPPAPPSPAASVVARATDPATGTVDTAKLARWVADAATQSPETASAAHEAIESQLGIGDVGRFNADVRSAFAARQNDGCATYSATGAALAPGISGSRILTDNPILEVQWRSTVSPITGKSGFTGPLQRLLDDAGIRTDFRVSQRPATGIATNGPGVSTHNGNAARDAIATQMQSSGQYRDVVNERDGLIVRQTSLGDRHLDIAAKQDGPRPQEARVVEVESKLGRASASSDTRVQVAKDAERIADNVSVRRIGSALEGVGRVARPIGLVVDAVQVGSAFRADGNSFGDNTQRAVGSLAGGAAGAWGGAQLGATIGSFGGPIGTVAGGVIGAAVGGIIGSGVGAKAVDFVKSWF